MAPDGCTNTTPRNRIKVVVIGGGTIGMKSLITERLIQIGGTCFDISTDTDTDIGGTIIVEDTPRISFGNTISLAESFRNFANVYYDNPLIGQSCVKRAYHGFMAPERPNRAYKLRVAPLRPSWWAVKGRKCLRHAPRWKHGRWKSKT